MLKEISKRPLSELQVREPVRVAQTTQLGEIVERMAKEKRGAVCVEDAGGKLVGIFTEHDAMVRLDHGSTAWRTMPVREVMIKNPKTLRSSSTVREALAMMTAGKFRRVPIVDDDGRAIGIVSVRNILAHVASFFPEEFLNLPPDPEHEASGQWGG